jgi:hypothetical protein
VVEAGADVNNQVGKRVSLNPRIKGGDGKYTYAWYPEEGLTDPTSPRAKVDTGEPFTRTYTLTVNDESGNSHEDSLTVTIKEKPKKIEPQVVEADPEPAPPPPPVDKRWTDRKNMQLSMTLMRSDGDLRIQEVMVYNKKSKETTYYPVQAEFDGGTLVSVHPRGGVVRRDTGGEPAFFVYPIGARLDQDVRAEEAGDHPLLQRLALSAQEDALVERAAEAEEESEGENEENEDDLAPQAEEAGTDTPTELKPEPLPAGAEPAGRGQPGARDAGKPVPGESKDKTSATKPGSAEEKAKAGDKKVATPKPTAKAKKAKPASTKAKRPAVESKDPEAEATGDDPRPSAKPKAKAKKGKAKSRKTERGRASRTTKSRAAAARKGKKLEALRDDNKEP